MRTDIIEKLILKYSKASTKYIKFSLASFFGVFINDNNGINVAIPIASNNPIIRANIRIRYRR